MKLQKITDQIAGLGKRPTVSDEKLRAVAVFRLGLSLFLLTLLFDLALSSASFSIANTAENAT